MKYGNPKSAWDQKMCNRPTLVRWSRANLSRGAAMSFWFGVARSLCTKQSTSGGQLILAASAQLLRSRLPMTFQTPELVEWLVQTIWTCLKSFWASINLLWNFVFLALSLVIEPPWIDKGSRTSLGNWKSWGCPLWFHARISRFQWTSSSIA